MNRLANETSPYLLQHARNPVDWYPWGSEALDRARAEDKPILLSIGYAACHWCHVMEHESFEDASTAALMNELFINIKVDREERPDLDSIYMQAVQAMTGHGGWPMTVFLTPLGEPFYGGTYFPPVDRHGMPSFKRLLASVHEAYRSKRTAVANTAEKLREIYDAALRPMPRGERLNRETLESAFHVLAQSYDVLHGGFGGAPKFPPSMSLDFLLRWHARTGTVVARDIAVNTMRAMVRGGIYDQVGGGLHRYSVDEKWLVPHFEKMLYDNALFSRLGVHLWQATGDAEIRDATRDTFRWLLREMTSPEGGFYSSLDADSEGEEGKFYVWSEHELDALLGSDSAVIKSLWGVSAGGNFEGRNILFLPNDSAAVADRHGIALDALQAIVNRARALLYDVRARRVWPGRDEKILAGLNGLMLRALCEGARAFDDAELRAAALRNASFLKGAMCRDGRIVRSYKDGSARDIGFLEDHASVALAFLDVYALTFDAQWLAESERIAAATVDRFYDESRELFFDTPSDHETLITRPRDITDNALPSGTSLVAELLTRLAIIGGNERYAKLSSDILSGVGDSVARYPSAFGHLLGVADMAVFGAIEVTLAGRPDGPAHRALARAVGRGYVASLVLAGGEIDVADTRPMLRGRSAAQGAATAYVCRHYACDAPTQSPDELIAQLAVASRASK